MRKLLLTLAVLVVALAGGATLVWSSPAAPADPPPTAERLARMDPIVLPVIRKGEPVAQVTVVLVLEMVAGQNRDAAVAVMPKLRSACIMKLSELLSYDWPNGDPFDLGFGRKVLQSAADRVMGPGHVARVLFDMVRVRPL